MRKIVLILVTISLAVGVCAQTRRIAHRSHCGMKLYRHSVVKDNYGIPMHTTLYTTMPRIPMPVSEVTWSADTVNGAVVWRLDTLRSPVYDQPKAVSYDHLIIGDVRELGHLCSKSTNR